MLSIKLSLLQIATLLCCFPLCLVRAQDPFAYINPEELNYAIYPVGARQCVLNHVRQLSCNRANTFTWNGCVCSNGENILFNVASCVKEASPGDMASTYSALKAGCGSTGTPISVSFEQWMDTETYGSGSGSGTSINSSGNGLATHSTTHSASDSATHSATDSATHLATDSATHSSSGAKTEDGDAGGLSKSDQIALGAGISGGVLALVGVIIAWCMCRQGRTAMTHR